MTIELKPFRRRDARRCAELEAVLFEGDDPWPESAFLAELASSHIYYLAARDGHTLVGYGGISRLGRHAPEYEIHTIGVDPAYQKQGLGRRLLDALLAHADQDPGPVFWRYAPIMRRRLLCTKAPGLRPSGCASGTTPAAVPMPSP